MSNTKFCEYVFLNNSRNHKKGDKCNRRMRTNKSNKSELYCWEHCKNCKPVEKNDKDEPIVEGTKKEDVKNEDGNIKVISTNKKHNLDLPFIELKNSV